MKALNIALLLLVAALVYVGTAHAEITGSQDNAWIVGKIMATDLRDMDSEIAALTKAKNDAIDMSNKENSDSPNQGYDKAEYKFEVYEKAAKSLRASLDTENPTAVAKAYDDIHQMRVDAEVDQFERAIHNQQETSP